MKVEQLIRALQTMPRDAPVLIACAEGGACDIARPRLARASLHHNGFEGDGGPHRLEEGGAVEVVQLAPGPVEAPLMMDAAEAGDLAMG